MPNRRKYLKEHYPWVLEGWHPTRNSGVTTSELFVSSPGDYWWVCIFGHPFPQRIAKRIQGSGCLVCQGFIVPGVNDFFSRFPQMRAAYTAANHEEPPTNLPTTQREPERDWQCPRGHHYSANIRQVSYNLNASGEPCDTCRKAQRVIGKNLWVGFSEHLEDWDWLNNELGPEFYSWGSSSEEVSWRCSSGHPPYLATPYQKRTRERMCPACPGSHKLVVGINDLATTHPKVAERWDFEANDKSPDDLKIGMNIDVILKCKINAAHRPKMYLPNLKKNSEACTDCWRNALSLGENDLETVGKDFVSEWDFDENLAEYGVKDPSEIKWSDERRFAWICKSDGHKFKMAPYYRVVRNYGCTVCSNRVVLPGFNDLQHLLPELAQEWCDEKNGLTPQQVTPKSGKTVYWTCDEGHEPYPSTIWNRSQAETGCPKCSKFGYKDDQPGLLYLVEREDASFGRRARKVGITGAERSHIRLAVWRRQGFETVQTWTRPDGFQIRSCEAEVLGWLRSERKMLQYLKSEEMPAGGETETFSASGVSNHEIIERIDLILGR